MMKRLARWILRKELKATQEQLSILEDVGRSFYNKTIALKKENDKLRNIIVEDDKKKMKEIIKEISKVHKIKP